VTLLIALTIAITSGGRVFTRSPRGGRVVGVERDHSPILTFDLLAFRILGSDGTISRVGRWLHHWELDRIPELWNVLRGELELVGVKPLLPAEAAALSEEW